MGRQCLEAGNQKRKVIFLHLGTNEKLTITLHLPLMVIVFKGLVNVSPLAQMNLALLFTNQSVAQCDSAHCSNLCSNYSADHKARVKSGNATHGGGR